MSASLSFVIPLVFYLLTLCPTVFWIDSGELIASAHSLGIAHPTGYPLYVILGRLFSLFPVGEVGARLSFLSAVSGAFSSLFVYLSSMKLTGRASVSLMCALTTAFSLHMWDLSNTAEVYSLGVLFVAVAVFFLIRLSAKMDTSDLYLLAFLLGLGMTNHLTLGIMVPAVVLVVCSAAGSLKRPVPVVLATVLFLFVLGLTLYLYIPIRAFHDPAMNWGDPRSLDDLLRTVSLSSHSGYFFTRSFSHVLIMLGGVRDFYLKGFGLPATLLSAAGIIIMLRKRRTLAVALVLPVLILTFFVINFGSGRKMAEEQQAFYLSSTVFGALFLGVTVSAIAGYMDRKLGGKAAVTVSLLSLAIPVSLLFVNYGRVDKSTDRSAVVFASLVYESMEKPAVLLTDHTTLAFLFMYSQVVENRWDDVVPVYTPLLEERWYRRQLVKTFDNFVLDTEQNIENLAFLVRNNSAGYTVYTRQAYQKKVIPVGFLEPAGPVMRVRLDKVPVDRDVLENHRTQMIPFEEEKPSLGNKYFKANLGLTYLEVASLAIEAGLYGEAYREVSKAKLLDPESPVPYLILSQIREKEGNLTEALEWIGKAVEKNPDDPGAMLMTGVLLERAGRDSDAVSAYRKTAEIDPGFAPAHGRLGLLLHRVNGDPSEILFHLREAVRLGYSVEAVVPVIDELEERELEERSIK